MKDREQIADNVRSILDSFRPFIDRASEPEWQYSDGILPILLSLNPPKG